MEEPDEPKDVNRKADPKLGKKQTKPSRLVSLLKLL